MQVQPVNDLPGAAGDTFTVDEDSIDNELDLLANDTTYPDEGETLSLVSVATPSAGGVASISNDGTKVIYTPAPDYFGTESFAYTVTDSNGGSIQANVIVTIENTPDAPTAIDDEYTVVVDSAGDGLDLSLIHI